MEETKKIELEIKINNNQESISTNNKYKELNNDYKKLINNYQNLNNDYQYSNKEYQKISKDHWELSNKYKELYKDYQKLESDYQKLNEIHQEQINTIKASIILSKENANRNGRPAISENIISKIKEMRKDGASVRKVAETLAISTGVVSKYDKNQTQKN